MQPDVRNRPNGGVGAVEAGLRTILREFGIAQTLSGRQQHALDQLDRQQNRVKLADFGQIKQVDRGHAGFQSGIFWVLQVHRERRTTSLQTWLAILRPQKPWG